MQQQIINKLPPHSIEAEEAVIGSLLIDGESIYEINSWIKSQDFFTIKCQWIYESILSVIGRGEAINQITVATDLLHEGRLEEIGGSSILSRIISECPTSLHIKHYARIVKNQSIQRRAISVGQKVIAYGYEEIDPVETVKKSEEAFLTLQKEVAMPRLIEPKEVTLLSTQRYDELSKGHRKGINTGFKELDESLGGLFGGELCYLAARPGFGKTELLLSIAQHVGLRFGNVLIASLEQPLGDITDRLVSRELEVSPRLIRAGLYPDHLMRRIMDFVGSLSESRLYFYDSGGDIDGRGATAKSIYSVANHMKFAYGISLVIIDYLGLLEDESGETKSYERVSTISRKLKKLSRDLDIPVLCAAQLNREVERRLDHRPIISDLRDSGNIEQDADAILFIYVPEKYEDEIQKAQEEHRDIKNMAEIHIGKVRQAGEFAGSKIELMWNPKKRCYYDRYMAGSKVPDQFK